MGAGRTRDAGTSVVSLNRVDAIAGKPTPTKARSHIGFMASYLAADTRHTLFPTSSATSKSPC